ALLLSCQFLDNLVQLVEACVPALSVPLEPRRLFLQSARAQLARPHAPDLLRGDKPRLLQNADVLLHARERHVELLGKVRDRSVGTSELPQNPAPGGIRERGERVIEAGLHILNHVVQYTTQGAAIQGEAVRPAMSALEFRPRDSYFASQSTWRSTGRTGCRGARRWRGGDHAEVAATHSRCTRDGLHVGSSMV